MTIQQVKIRKINKNVMLPKRNGAFYDLFMPENTWIEPGKSVLVRLGFACQLPKGYHACILPRSSTFKVYHVLLANSMGIVDNAYCGNSDEWMLSLYLPAEFKDPVKIPKDARIAQFEVVKDCVDLDFVEVEELANDDRGGFGSTGK